MARRKIYEPWEFLEHTPAVHEVLNNGTDLACAIVGTAYLEALLGSLLKARFVDERMADKMLDPNTGVLGGFKARADMAYGLGLLRKEALDDLSIIAKIRNLFAHSHLSLDFESDDVRMMCGQLHTWHLAIRAGLPPGSVKGARSQFRVSVAILGEWIQEPTFGLDREKRNKRSRDEKDKDN